MDFRLFALYCACLCAFLSPPIELKSQADTHHVNNQKTNSQKIDELMTAFQRIGQFNGTVLVAENGEVIFNKGFGFANIPFNIENTKDTRFLLASVSKQFTAMLTLQLVTEGKIQLHTTIDKYLSWYPVHAAKQITIHHLLTHSSGIPDVSNQPGFDKKYAHQYFEPKNLVSLFDTLALEFKPGSAFSYSNSGYSLLAVILEEVTKKDFGSLLSQYITGPLGMHNTGMALNKPPIKNLANSYQWAALDGYINAAYFDNSISLGAGGIYSTTGDLAIWDSALYTNKLIPDSLLQKMLSPQNRNYGYGFFISKWPVPGTSDTATIIDHGGANAGFNTLIWRSVTHKHLIVLLANTNEAKFNFIRNRIRSILYKRPYDLPEPEIRHLLASALRKGGIDSLRKEFQRVKTTLLEEYGESEFIFNVSEVGYSLVLSDRFDLAIDVYKLNTAAFPKSVKALDDLGEAYMFKGDLKNAISCYAKAQKLDPKNNRVNAILLKLRAETKQ